MDFALYWRAQKANDAFKCRPVPGREALNQAEKPAGRVTSGRACLRLLCINKDLSETLMQKKCVDYANDANVSA